MDNLSISEGLYFYICLYSKNGHYNIQPYFNFQLYTSLISLLLSVTGLHLPLNQNQNKRDLFCLFWWTFIYSGCYYDRRDAIVFKTLPFCLKSSEIVYSECTAISEQLLLASTRTTTVMHTLFPGTASSLPGAYKLSGFRISPDLWLGTLITAATSRL